VITFPIGSAFPTTLAPYTLSRTTMVSSAAKLARTAGKAISWTRVVDFISVCTVIVFGVFICLLIDLKTVLFLRQCETRLKDAQLISQYISHSSSSTLLSERRIRSARKGESGGIN